MEERAQRVGEPVQYNWSWAIYLQPEPGGTGTYLQYLVVGLGWTLATALALHREDEDVLFIGRSLFRSSIELPANMPVGPLDTRVYLFRQGKLIDTYNSRIMLEREGAERWLHGFAMEQPLFYGVFVVAVALSAGLLASAIFARGS